MIHWYCIVDGCLKLIVCPGFHYILIQPLCTRVWVLSFVSSASVSSAIVSAIFRGLHIFFIRLPVTYPFKSFKIYYNIPSNLSKSYCPRFSRLCILRFILRYTRLSRISYRPRFSRKIEIHANPWLSMVLMGNPGGVAHKYMDMYGCSRILSDKYIR